ncbi:hypothetical protein COOONC_26372 [Cooperia oncophora]
MFFRIKKRGAALCGRGGEWRALCFIHRSALHLHGFLTSKCCLVDERWVVKISDFGLDRWRLGDNLFKKIYYGALRNTFEMATSKGHKRVTYTAYQVDSKHIYRDSLLSSQNSTFGPLELEA